MSEFGFDRDAVQVSAKADWLDHAEFARVGSYLSEMIASAAADPLPVGSSDGVTALKERLALFSNTMAKVAFEYSDACAVLGAGQESAIANTDATEAQSTQRFLEIAKRLEGE